MIFKLKLYKTYLHVIYSSIFISKLENIEFNLSIIIMIGLQKQKWFC